MRLVIVGGGFGGLRVAKILRKRLPDLEIVLFDNQGYHLYTPRLYSILEHDETNVSFSLPEIAKAIDFRFIHAVVGSINPRQKELTFRLAESQGGKTGRMSFDFAVLAFGSRTDFFSIPGMRDHAFAFKTFQDAILLREHLESQMVEAAKSQIKNLKNRLRVIVIGGGPSGVELAAVMKELIEDHLPRFGLSSQGQVILIEAADRLLPQMPKKASIVAERRLRELGVKIMVSTLVKKKHIDRLQTQRNKTIYSETIIWTGGVSVTGPKIRPETCLFDGKGRIEVARTLAAEGCSNIYIIGDAASVRGGFSAQAALKQAEVAAENIYRDIFDLGGRVAYRPGLEVQLIPLGRNFGIGVFGRSVLASGFIAWLRRKVDRRYIRSLGLK